MKKKMTLTVLFAFFSAASFAHATTFNINTIDGDWINAEPASAITIVNSGSGGGLSTARWGNPVNSGEQSGYDFLSTGTPFDVDADGNLFALGTFTHQNYPITGTALDTIELDISIEDLGIFDIGAIFNIDHNETPNTNNPPDDFVTLLNPIVNELFSYDGVDYYFNLVGFSQDGGKTVSNIFQTQENASNVATLYGRITSSPIPEPTTMLLFGTGIAGLAAIGRRRK